MKLNKDEVKQSVHNLLGYKAPKGVVKCLNRALEEQTSEAAYSVLVELLTNNTDTSEQVVHALAHTLLVLYKPKYKEQKDIKIVTDFLYIHKEHPERVKLYLELFHKYNLPLSDFNLRKFLGETNNILFVSNIANISVYIKDKYSDLDSLPRVEITDEFEIETDVETEGKRAINIKISEVTSKKVSKIMASIDGEKPSILKEFESLPKSKVEQVLGK